MGRRNIFQQMVTHIIIVQRPWMIIKASATALIRIRAAEIWPISPFCFFFLKCKYTRTELNSRTDAVFGTLKWARSPPDAQAEVESSVSSGG